MQEYNSSAIHVLFNAHSSNSLIEEYEIRSDFFNSQRVSTWKWAIYPLLSHYLTTVIITRFSCVYFFILTLSQCFCTIWNSLTHSYFFFSISQLFVSGSRRETKSLKSKERMEKVDLFNGICLKSNWKKMHS